MSYGDWAMFTNHVMDRLMKEEFRYCDVAIYQKLT